MAYPCQSDLLSYTHSSSWLANAAVVSTALASGVGPGKDSTCEKRTFF